ncbi:hypothetical protein [Paenarthrobacter sp. AMU7]|uniref:DUF1269 domain-containing protein n=1 Tax=Paenarthrobacter sp. AMU7 TaxID=3162492 RepID=A0AB39YSB4_9MICC
MKVGPVEVIVCVFPQHAISQRVVEALRDAVQYGGVALIDVVLVSRKDPDSVMVTDLDDGLGPEWSELIIDPRPMILLSEADLNLVVQFVRSEETALVAVIEHRWARMLLQEVEHANGFTPLHARIPHDVTVRAFQADETAAS